MAKYVHLVATILLGFALSPSAQAGKTTVSVDTDFVLPLGNSNSDTAIEGAEPEESQLEMVSADPEIEAGYSVTLRAGYKLSFVIVDVTPEVGLRSLQLRHGQPLTFVYGGRVAVGKLIKPGIYGHGLIDFDGSRGWEAGLTGDFTALPIINLGVQAGYGEFDSVPMINAGIHATLEF